MFGDRHVNEPPTVVRQDDEHEEQPEGHRRDDEQVGGHDLTGVMVRNVRHVGEGGRGCWRMYLATVD